MIRASSSSFTEGLGQILRRNGIVTEDQIDEALSYQQSLTEHQPLGRILRDLYQIPTAVVERAVEGQIEKIVFSFFSWREGSFSFRMEELTSFGSAVLNPLDFMLEKGLSPQRLAIKGQKVFTQGGVVDEEMVDKEVLALRTKQQQQGIDLLRGMLAELEHPEYCGGIILLILRYASEIMERAIIFDVRGQQLVGLGQFGLETEHGSADDIVRKLRIQVEENSFFDRVLSARKARCGSLGDLDSERYLKTFLGHDEGEVFVAPLVNDDTVVALLYGDRLFNNKAWRSIEAFEVFLSQAGLALEQALQGKSAG